MKDDPTRNKENWYMSIFYFNREDPRLIVPKRISKLGWTTNFARPMAIPSIIIMIILVLAPFKILSCYGIHSLESRYAVIAIEIIVISLFCKWSSNLDRFTKDKK